MTGDRNRQAKASACGTHDIIASPLPRMLTGLHLFLRILSLIVIVANLAAKENDMVWNHYIVLYWRGRFILRYPFYSNYIVTYYYNAAVARCILFRLSSPFSGFLRMFSRDNDALFITSSSLLHSRKHDIVPLCSITSTSTAVGTVYGFAEGLAQQQSRPQHLAERLPFPLLYRAARLLVEGVTACAAVFDAARHGGRAGDIALTYHCSLSINSLNKNNFNKRHISVARASHPRTREWRIWAKIWRLAQ